jgi:hypothetical protein
MFQPRGESIMELLMRQGDVAGRAALMRGEAISRGIEGVGNAVAQGVMAYGQKKSDDKIRMQLDDAIGSWDGKDAMGLWRKVVVAVGPSRASQIVPGLVSLFKTAQGAEPTPADLKTTLGTISAARKVYGDEGMVERWGGFAPALKRMGSLFGMQVPDQYTPEVGNFVDTTLEKLGEKPTEPKTRLVERTLPDGSKVQEIVADKPGQTFTSAAPPPKPENLTGEEAYIRAMFGPNPTAEQILQGRARYAAAGREPDKPQAPVEHDIPTTGVVITTYGAAKRPEIRKQAQERGIPVFESATNQKTANVLAGIYEEAQELKNLLSLDKVKAAIGMFAGRLTALQGRLFDNLDPDVQRAIQLMTSLSDTELRKRSGAAVTLPEMKRILSFSTDPNQPYGHNITAINGLLKSSNRDYYNLSGGVWLSGAPDSEENDPLGLR